MSGLDAQKLAAYEHRKFLSHLSDKLSRKELRKIVFHEDLPKGLLDSENESPDPLEVMKHLQMQEKTTPEELSRILGDINRQDLVKLVIKSAKKNSLTRKNSGPSSPKLEDTLNITIKSGDLLLEQLELLLKHAASKGSKRIEEVLLMAKTNLTDVVQRKLRYASGLLSSQRQPEHFTNVSNSNSPSGPSPESSLTVKASPSNPGHQRPQISDVDLKKAVESLKPPSVTRRGATPTQKDKENQSSPTNSSRNSSDNEDDIYIVPGPVKTTASPTQASDATYCNYPVRNHCQPLSAPGSENGKALLVTGSSKTAKPGPTTKPKPLKGKSHTTATVMRYPEKTMDASPADDVSSSTYSYTGDSGFSDSRAFLQKESPPSSPQHTSAECVLDSGASYASLISSDVRNNEYYKSLNRECIPEVIYGTNDQPSNKN